MSMKVLEPNGSSKDRFRAFSAREFDKHQTKTKEGTWFAAWGRRGGEPALWVGLQCGACCFY